MLLDIFRPDVDGAVTTIHIDESNAMFTQSLMGEHKIVVSTSRTVPLQLNLNDYILYNNVMFSMNTQQTIEKISRNNYKIDITFEAPMYKMYNRILRSEDDAEFSYSGTLLDYLILVVNNMNEIDTGWTVGECEATDIKLIQFTNMSCLQALSTICNTNNFNCEFYVVDKTINLVNKVGYDTTFVFAYGKGKGLFNLKRQNIQDKNLVTRLIPYGGTTNLPANYAPNKLMLPEKYLEKNTSLYRVVEGANDWPDIYPQRNGALTAVANDGITIEDSTLDFNMNAQIVQDTPKMVMQSGALSGYEFEISSYVDANKSFRINKFKDSDGTVLPNSTTFFSVGDKYTLTGITMPQSYVDAAIDRLRNEAQAYLDENSTPRVEYDLTFSEIYAKQNNVVLGVGDRIKVVDDPLHADSKIRVSAISYPLARPHKIKATIADSVGYTYIEKVIAQTVNNKTIIKKVDRTQEENARLNYATFQDIKKAIFDPDGYFDGGALKPNSVETLYLGVGSESQSFKLSGVYININAGGDPNTLDISEGDLYHYAYSITGLGNVWHIDNKTITGMDGAKMYYLYARCSKTSLHGEWKVETDHHTTNEETGYYWLLTGVITKADDVNGRDYKLINGMTIVTGDRIVTGRIEDLSGQNYWDLNAGSFWLGKKGGSIDWNVTQENTLTIDGAIVTKMFFADDAEIINLKVDSLVTTNPTTANPNPQRIEIKKETNSLKFFDGVNENAIVSIDVQPKIDGYGGGGGLQAMDNYKGSQATTNGLFSNAGKQTFLPSSSGIGNNASVVGLLQNRLPDTGSMSAAVVGIDQTSLQAGYGIGFGGYFNTIFIGDLNLKARYINVSTTQTIAVNREDSDIYCYNSANITLQLPYMQLNSDTPAWNNNVIQRAKPLFIHQINLSSVTINAANGNQILRNSGSSNNITMDSRGECAVFFWNGSHWVVHKLVTY